METLWVRNWAKSAYADTKMLLKAYESKDVRDTSQT